MNRNLRDVLASLADPTGLGSRVDHWVTKDTWEAWLTDNWPIPAGSLIAMRDTTVLSSNWYVYTWTGAGWGDCVGWLPGWVFP